MRRKLLDIPEVSLSDTDEFWVVGSQYDDGILGQYNLKMDLKEAIESAAENMQENEGNENETL